MKSNLNRRAFLTVSAGVSVGTILRAQTKNGKADSSGPALEWFNVEDWGVEGRGWTEQARKRYFDRFPAKAEGVIRDAVWNLSRDSAGMLARFETDSPEIHVRYRLFRDRIEMPHMPATGVSGVDLYGRNPKGTWRWIAVSRPSSQDVSGKLIDGLDGKTRAYSLYLPLYNGVDSLELGVVKKCSFQGIPPRTTRPVVFYGTSITHGACASRPGMPHPAILGRRLDVPFINLGFSGNGRMEAEVGALLAELDPLVYVVDCLPNMDGPMVEERAQPLVRQLRKAHPKTPIVLVEDRSFTNSWVQSSRREHHEKSRLALKKAYQALLGEGVGKLYYLEGESLLGADGEASTDGSHPSDLGFVRQSDAFEPVLRKAIREAGA